MDPKDSVIMRMYCTLLALLTLTNFTGRRGQVLRSHVVAKLHIPQHRVHRILKIDMGFSSILMAFIFFNFTGRSGQVCGVKRSYNPMRLQIYIIPHHKRPSRDVPRILEINMGISNTFIFLNFTGRRGQGYGVKRSYSPTRLQIYISLNIETHERCT